MAQGIGYHHAGMAYDDRKIIEQLFKQEKVKILCTTSTLATGVNLPARLVIIKSTLQYIGGKIKPYQEYSSMDVLQMIGRAGRLQVFVYTS